MLDRLRCRFVEADRLSSLLEDLIANGEVWVPDAKRYLISPSRPAADCSLMAAWMEGIRTTGASKAGCSIVSVLTLHLTLFGCTPTQREAKPPPADQITAAAIELTDAAQAMWYGVLAAWKDGTLFPSDGSLSCSEIDLTTGMRAIDASGGLAGWDIPIAITL